MVIKVLSTVVCLYSFCCVYAVESGENSQTQKSKQEENTMVEASQVAAKHILVSTEQEAKDLLTKIRNGEITFENAARDFSKCPSKLNGGDLGFFGKNMMVKEFETVAFSLNANEVSEPVKTQFGWHLIKVYDKK